MKFKIKIIDDDKKEVFKDYEFETYDDFYNHGWEIDIPQLIELLAQYKDNN
jgi:hypothetical protein|tara:strand:- start:620 stop:772 length:153 start_codon:yes stop_codon:yes gene_type:complete